jgi:hypothetical protein
MTLLWHGDEPIGICVFVSPPLSLAARNRFFGRSGRWDRTAIRVMNRKLVMLQRVVLHPTYRGAGIAVPFVRRSCELCDYDWIETLTQLGHIHPLFERAGFARLGTARSTGRTRREQSALYGGRRPAGRGLVTSETHRKSRHACPVYYLFDNRSRGERCRHPIAAPAFSAAANNDPDDRSPDSSAPSRPRPVRSRGASS